MALLGRPELSVGQDGRAGQDGVRCLVGSLDDPSVVEPSEHIFAEPSCNWLRLDDDMRAHARFPRGEEDREPG